MRYLYKNYNTIWVSAFFWTFTAAFLTGFNLTVQAQESPKEEDFFRIMKVRAPEGILLEVGGLTVLPNGDLGVSTRRGEVYIVENPTSSRPYFRRFAHGLHEILGLAYKDGALYCAQRGELTKLQDTDHDGKADVYETIYAWPLSGHYHEYSFGPELAPDGSFFVSANVAFGDEEWWRGESRVPWRGWVMKISEDGKMEPWATGMRSPAGLGLIDGELFYTENQGDWIGSGAIFHLTKGAFTGHPAGLRWADMPGSPVKLTISQLYAKVDPRQVKNKEGRYIKPENIIQEKALTRNDVKEQVPELQTPAVWLPHGILGISNSDIVKIPDFTFGPFAGQLLVGDQGQSKIMRVFIEKVDGEYQGAAWDFRSGFQSGVLRLSWAQDGSLFVGETNRGWGSAGEANEGLQRLVWNNSLPFEMKTIHAMPDGFEVEFTKPVDVNSAEDIASYSVESFTYKYHPVYGSPPVNTEEAVVKGVKLSEDGLKARIIVDNLREGYIHHIKLDGVREKDHFYSLIHPSAYYTLNKIPPGEKLSMNEVSTRNSAVIAENKSDVQKAPDKTSATSRNTNSKKARVKSEAKGSPEKKAPAFADIQPLLAKNTCLACHQQDKRQVGPAFVEIAKRNYEPKEIIKLIHNPQPQNWPGYTPMPPMPQVSEADALKIANWINSLTVKQ